MLFLVYKKDFEKFQKYALSKGYKWNRTDKKIYKWNEMSFNMFFDIMYVKVDEFGIMYHAGYQKKENYIEFNKGLNLE